MHVVKHGTDALTSGVLQSEQSCTHVETHEATLLERFHNTLHRTGHDPTGQWEKQGPIFMSYGPFELSFSQITLHGR